MSGGINDTARCAPATAGITAVNWVCNGLVFQARVCKEQIQSYVSAGRGCAVTSARIWRDQVGRGGRKCRLSLFPAFQQIFQNKCEGLVTFFCNSQLAWRIKRGYLRTETD